MRLERREISRRHDAIGTVIIGKQGKDMGMLDIHATYESLIYVMKSYK
jgi:hypothetical protein